MTICCCFSAVPVDLSLESRDEHHVPCRTPEGSTFKLLVPGRGRQQHSGYLRIHELHSGPKGLDMAYNSVFAKGS